MSLVRHKYKLEMRKSEATLNGYGGAPCAPVWGRMDSDTPLCSCRKAVASGLGAFVVPTTGPVIAAGSVAGYLIGPTRCRKSVQWLAAIVVCVLTACSTSPVRPENGVTQSSSFRKGQSQAISRLRFDAAIVQLRLAELESCTKESVSACTRALIHAHDEFSAAVDSLSREPLANSVNSEHLMITALAFERATGAAIEGSAAQQDPEIQVRLVRGVQEAYTNLSMSFDALGGPNG